MALSKWRPLLVTLPIYVLGWLYLRNYDKIPFHIVCPSRFLTGIPCPGCGMTRAFLALLRGDFAAAAHRNILAFPLFAFLAVAPVWMLADAVAGKRTLHQALTHTWSLKPLIAILLAIVACWLWNLHTVAP